jgi:hypothetical protein
VIKDSNTEGPESNQRNDAHPGGRHYVAELARDLSNIPEHQLRRGERFPSGLELRFAPAQFRSILAVTKSLLEADWAALPREIVTRVPEALTQLLEVARRIERYPAGHKGAPRDFIQEIEKELDDMQRFFSERVEPAVEAAAAVERSAANAGASIDPDEFHKLQADLKAANQNLDLLERRNAEISAELDGRRALVEARRDETGSSGAAVLAQAYSEQALRHTRQWWYWGGGLIGALILAIGVGLLLLLQVNELPADAEPAQIASHVALDVLVIGLLIYMVRIASHQFSVHRHLAAVADSKAAALLTFSRIVSAASEPETRTAIAGILAQSVFSSDHTGFIASSHDQVTLIERLAGTVSQRATNGS